MKSSGLVPATVAMLAAVVLGLPGATRGKGGVYDLTRHGDPAKGILRTADWPRGDCGQCHDLHDGAAPNPFGLFAPPTNALCATAGCHGGTSANAIYQGPAAYDAAAHAMSSSMLWPGADSTVDGSAPRARPSGDAGKCVNCHDPHGYNMDGTGLIPSLLVSREERLCYVCHDSNGPANAAKNVKGEFGKTYRHPIEMSGKHSASEGGSPAAYGVTPTNNRHSECDDCHNAHVARADGAAPTPPTASNRLVGVGRVAVVNGAAGSTPTFIYRGPGDATPPVAEYQVCFKCHSSWTTQPLSQTDLAVRFNSNNRSYHPVEAVGKNTNISASAFVNGWTGTRMMYCTDCHTSDGASAPRGPHGSTFRYILKLPYTASSASRTMLSTETCFDCHRYDTYANDNATNTIKGYSRFNQPLFREGHTYHVGVRQRPCYACHDSHGSTTLPHLMVTGRSPGLTSYSETGTGGTCAPTCHGTKPYTINYAR